MTHFVALLISLFLSVCCLLCNFQMLSFALWNEWLFVIYRWIGCQENRSMANSGLWLLWILWWHFTYVHKCCSKNQIETGCKSLQRKLLGPHDGSSGSSVCTLCQNHHSFLCKFILKNWNLISHRNVLQRRKKDFLKKIPSIYVEMVFSIK